jgi:hypothetical protein
VTKHFWRSGGGGGDKQLLRRGDDMATAAATAQKPTATPAPAFGPISEMERSRKALATLRGLLATEAEIKSRMSVGAEASEMTKALIRRDYQSNSFELLTVNAAIVEARQAAEAADEMDRAERREEFRQLKRPAVAAAVKALRLAQVAMEELGRLENLEHEIFGAAVDRAAWPNLLRNDVGLSFVDEWVERLRQDGLIDG